jgi:two-component system, OmpR family, phosphate regulon sensor histidine kinase PhoR
MQRWRREIRITLSLFALSLIASYFIGHLILLLLISCIFLLTKQTLAVNRLENALSRGGKLGDTTQYKGIWSDIYYHLSKMKKAEKKRKKKLGNMIDQFRSSSDAFPDAAVVLTKFGEIAWSNKAAFQVLGLKKSDKHHRIINLVRAPQFVNYLKAGNYQQKISIQSPVNDNLTLQISIVPYGDQLRLLLAQDITHLKRMERMRTDFVANVSHELRTPLTVLKGYLETLQDLDEQPPLLNRSLTSMTEQTERMQVLIDDLLVLSKLETQAKKNEFVDIPHLLEQICQEGRSLTADERTINLDIQADTHLRGDQQELRSAFANLLANALKYSTPQAPVHMRWFLLDHNTACLEVEDFGEGINDIDISRITERFYRVEHKRPHKISGTGLGLAIVKHVLMRHDAKLDIESQPGVGSRFRCLFPKQRFA